MKLFVSICLFAFITSFTVPTATWLGDINAAKETAAKDHKFIILNFSGSDWCGPCIRLRHEILESATFQNYAQANLVLVRADFPRQKKNQLSAEQTKLNEAMADKYNSEGKFPYTLLLDANGKVLKAWDGFPNESAQNFVGEINGYVHAEL